jgi:hypothetical protein
LYFPAAHGPIGPPSGPVYPALATQALSVVLPEGEEELSGQLEHKTEPPELYLFDKHIEHVPPFVPEKPALQTQAPIVELPAGEFESVGQSEHVEPAPEYFPAPH